MDTKIILSATWVVVTLIYLYDDVLRICSGDFAKSMANMSFNQGIWLGIAILMLMPISPGQTLRCSNFMVGLTKAASLHT